MTYALKVLHEACSEEMREYSNSTSLAYFRNPMLYDPEGERIQRQRKDRIRELEKAIELIQNHLK